MNIECDPEGSLFQTILRGHVKVLFNFSIILAISLKKIKQDLRKFDFFLLWSHSQQLLIFYNVIAFDGLTLVIPPKVHVLKVWFQVNGAIRSWIVLLYT